jgi:hypothetical protein
MHSASAYAVNHRALDWQCYTAQFACMLDTLQPKLSVYVWQTATPR